MVVVARECAVRSGPLPFNVPRDLGIQRGVLWVSECWWAHLVCLCCYCTPASLFAIQIRWSPQVTGFSAFLFLTWHISIMYNVSIDWMRHPLPTLSPLPPQPPAARSLLLIYRLEGVGNDFTILEGTGFTVRGASWIGWSWGAGETNGVCSYCAWVMRVMSVCMCVPHDWNRTVMYLCIMRGRNWVALEFYRWNWTSVMMVVVVAAAIETRRNAASLYENFYQHYIANLMRQWQNPKNMLICS